MYAHYRQQRIQHSKYLLCLLQFQQQLRQQQQDDPHQQWHTIMLYEIQPTLH